jgi:hypothetical protein
VLRLPHVWALSALLLAAAAPGCASGGGGDVPRDAGGVRHDTGIPDLDGGSTDGGGSADAANDTSSIDDAASTPDSGPVDAGPPPPGDNRTTYVSVSGGHIASSGRYRFVGSLSALGSPSPPSSSHYVLHENVIGRIGDPSP